MVADSTTRARTDAWASSGTCSGRTPPRLPPSSGRSTAADTAARADPAQRRPGDRRRAAGRLRRGAAAGAAAGCTSRRARPTRRPPTRICGPGCPTSTRCCCPRWMSTTTSTSTGSRSRCRCRRSTRARSAGRCPSRPGTATRRRSRAASARSSAGTGCTSSRPRPPGSAYRGRAGPVGGRRDAAAAAAGGAGAGVRRSSSRKYEAKLLAYNAEVDRFAAAVAGADPASVVEYFAMVLGNSVYPDDFPQHFRLAYLPQAAAPADRVPPAAGRGDPGGQGVPLRPGPRRPAGGAARRRRDPPPVRRDHRPGDAAHRPRDRRGGPRRPGRAQVLFNGIVDTIDRRTGTFVRPCLVSVRTDRETFAAIKLRRVDPVACLKHLRGRALRPARRADRGPPAARLRPGGRPGLHRGVQRARRHRRAPQPGWTCRTTSTSQLLTDLFGNMGLEMGRATLTATTAPAGWPPTRARCSAARWSSTRCGALRPGGRGALAGRRGGRGRRDQGHPGRHRPASSARRTRRWPAGRWS